MATKAISVKVAKVKPTYDRMHRAWRAGVISDFYYGRRGPRDAALVWRLDDREWSAEDPDARAEIAVLLDEAFAAAGLADVEWGAQWCGFRSVILVGLDGSRLVMDRGGSRYEEVAA